MKQIRTVNLGKNYGREKYSALEDLNLEIEENTIFGFLGPNGAGKTTTIKLLTGLMEPSRGQIWIGDRRLSGTSNETSRNIGYLGQSPGYYKWMTGNELLKMVASLFKFSKREAGVRAEELLELTGLIDHKNRRIGTYSGGMVQRLGIAQALVNRPDVLFLDEPVSDMDPLGRKEVLEFIESLRGYITVFMSSHILQDVERVCDTVGIIDKGRMIKLADTGTLKKEYGETRILIDFQNKDDADKSENWLSIRTSSFSRKKNAFILHQGAFSPLRSSFLHWAADNCPSLENLRVITPSLEDIFVKIIGGHYEKQNPVSLNV